MRNKKLIILLGLTVMLLAGLGLSRQQSTVQSKEESAQQKTAAVPDFVVYRHLFHHVIALKKKAEDAEKEGKDVTQY